MTSPLRWRYVLMFIVVISILFLALVPYMIDTKSELRIRVVQHGLALPDGFYIYNRLDKCGIRIKSITPENDSLVIQLDSPEQQQLAHEALQTILPSGYAMALSKSSAATHWVRKLVRSPFNLG